MALDEQIGQIQQRTAQPIALSSRRVWLAFELTVVYIGVPLLIYLRVLPNWPIPFLLGVAIWALLVLRRDPTFDQTQFYRMDGVWKGLGEVLLRDTALMTLLGLAVWRFSPGLLFTFIEATPWLWVTIIVLYPLFSVYPQELLYRAFFFHRYKPLFGSGTGLIAASAAAFGFVHIIFGNWISVVLSGIGGILFSLTYKRSGSLMLACVEHALFGNFIFTIGIGEFFVHAPR